MISISNITFSLDELNRKEKNIGITRSVAIKAMEEYEIGKNKNLYPIKIKCKNPIFKASLSLYISREKYLLLEETYNQQLSVKIFNYIPGSNINEILLTYSNPTTKREKCYIDKLELIDTVYINNTVKYVVDIDILEI
jgi:hypothetical protein